MKALLALLASIILLSACGNSLSKNAVESINGACPADHPIKGNRNSKGEWIFHVPHGQYYNRTDAEECFANNDDAIAAGYRKSKR